MAQVIFYHTADTSNANYNAGSYRSSATQFHVNTTGSVPTGLVVSNPVWLGGTLGFDIVTSAAQALTILYSTDCSLPLSQWQTLLHTNSTGTSVHITVPPQAAATGFFRVQN